MPILYADFQPIIVASTGRAGSTMMFEAIAKSLIWHSFRARSNSVLEQITVGYLDRFEQHGTCPSAVYKTHDLLPEFPPQNVRCIFIYGDPLEAALSVRDKVQQVGHTWFDNHQNNLRAVGALEHLFSADVLNFRGQLESYLSRRYDSVFCVDFEDLWSKRTALSNFLGFQVELPLRRQRSKKATEEDVDFEFFSSLRTQMIEMKAQYEARRIETIRPV